MNALLLFVGTYGWACLPPTNVELPHGLYSGPWVTTVSAAEQHIRTAPERGINARWFRIVRQGDPDYASILARCPTISY